MRRSPSSLAPLAVALVGGFVACGPRTRHARSPAQVATTAATPIATPIATTPIATAPTPSDTAQPSPEPPVLGPAWLPKGLAWPPGVPPIAIPAGFPSEIPPWPVVFPFPVPGVPPSPTTAPPNPTAAPAPAPPPPAPGDWPPASTAMEDEVIVEVNARRAAGATCGGKPFAPVGPLAFHPALRAAARGHSKDMATRGYFDHVAPDGSQPPDRMKAAGWNTSVGWTGENIAAGNATAKATVQQWMDSPGHCENIMSVHFDHIGVGYAFEQNSRFRHYWTQNFGGPP